jgi:hypothetical protein
VVGLSQFQLMIKKTSPLLLVEANLSVVFFDNFTDRDNESLTPEAFYNE